MIPSTFRTPVCRALGCAVALFAGAVYAGDDAPRPSAEALSFFESKVRPVLIEHCYKCHSDAKQKGKLRLDSRAGQLRGGEHGPALVPGNPEKSLLITALRHGEEDELKMPPSKKLPADKIASLTQWVKMGAPWPAGEKVAAAKSETPHWAFQPVKRPALPAVKNRAWSVNPIDTFILAGLEAKSLSPNPPASRTELLRRAYYDVTGLPPTPQEVEAFLADRSANAYESLVDRLLASPHYGEKWGRYWLDLVRFAETNSYERDNPKPNAWRYRDYVIRSLNQDKPYDRFLREQLAGDELPDGGSDGLIATGFYRLGIWDDEPTDREQARYDGLDDILATTGQALLGLTVDCARCHDHKIDPMPQADYYRLLAFFQNINHFRNGGLTDERPIFADQQATLAYEERVRDLENRRHATETEMEAIEKEFIAIYKGQTDEDKLDLSTLLKSDGARVLGKERFAHYEKLQRDLIRLKRQRVPGDLALCVTERGKDALATHVLRRGNPEAKGEKVEPGFPKLFAAPDPVIPKPAVDAKTTGRRLALADWIASPQNQLTARVMVNRVWQYHFGRGIVRSASNFGLQGDKPTHPELLDWLAAEFAAQGWRLKPLHRLILLSNAYQMSSRGRDDGLKADPVNDLFWRFDMRRLSAEEIRDSILAVNGTLSSKMLGPGVYVEIPKEVMAGQSMPGYGWGKSPPVEQSRRSVYIHVKRSLLTPILERFDIAEPDRSSPTRFATVQPTQALTMLNSEFLHKEATVFAERLRKEAGTDVEKQVRLAFTLATSRKPSSEEVRRGVELMAKLRETDRLDGEKALTYLCLLVLNLNEFVYVD
jgi:hypothetical protein